jgi:putative transport protein
MPYSANLTLRQFGLLLFFAGVGTRSGDAFAGTAFTVTGLQLFGLGLLSTALCALTVMLMGRALLGLSTARLWGVVAGTHTQPAALAFAVERSGGDERDGTLHRSVYRLCNFVHDALAIVVSQDGTVRFVKWHEGEVTYRDHVSRSVLDV